MDAHEIVVHEVDRDGVSVVLGFFREAICQSREPAHRYPHREVRPLRVPRADVPRIGVAGDHILASADAPSPASRAILARMEWVLAAAGIIGLIAAVWLLATRRGSPVEMPGGETIFGARPQPERPSPHRAVKKGDFRARHLPSGEPAD
jgi:hypothetical protein